VAAPSGAQSTDRARSRCCSSACESSADLHTLHGGHRQLALEQVIDLLGPVVEMQPDGRAGLEPRVDGQLEPGGEELLFEARLLREDPLGEISSC